MNTAEFRQGRLWQPIGVGDRQGMALVDTGASRTSLPASWLRRSELVGDARVETSFGTVTKSLYRVAALDALNHRYRDHLVFANQSSWPVLGLDVFLSDERRVIAMGGIRALPHVPEPGTYTCIPLRVSLSGDGLNRRVTGLYVDIDVDGFPQNAFLDTGQADTLQANGHAPRPAVKGRPRIGFFSNAHGQRRVQMYFIENGRLNIGGRSIETGYERFPSDFSEEVPFVLGAGLLSFFDIWLDRHRHAACLLPAAR